TVNVGDAVSVQVRVSTNGLSACQGGVFLQFDTARLNFVSGANDTTTWNSTIFNVQPAQNEPGVISLNVGAGSAVNSSNVLVSTLNFTATAAGTVPLHFLFNTGTEETSFYAADCTTQLSTNGTDGSVTIQTPTATPTNTATVTNTPTQTP